VVYVLVDDEGVAVEHQDVRELRKVERAEFRIPAVGN
jgi:hypothetical protein